MAAKALDVRTRLLLAFGAAIAFTILASAIGATALQHLWTSVARISGERLPVITAAYELAQQTESVVATAPRLVIASVQAERLMAVNHVTDQIRRLDDLITDLRHRRVVSVHLLDAVTAEKFNLSETFVALDAVVAERIVRTRDKRTLIAELGRIHMDVITIASQHDDVTDAAMHEMEEAAERTSFLLLHQAMTAALATHPAEVDDVEAAFEHSQAALKSLYGGLLATRAEAYATLADGLRRVCGGPNGLFATRRAELSLEGRVRGLLSAYSQVSARLVFAVNELIRRAQSDVDRSAGQNADLAFAATVVLAVVSGLCIVGSILIARHVSRSIVQRLSDLHYAMVTGAAGQPVRVATDGDDEIGRMARALQVFVTSREETEQALRSARDIAEAASRSKTRFLAAASHDLRQPLQALHYFASALSGRPLTRDERAIVGKMQGAMDALNGLLDGLLDISKLDAGIIEPHVVWFAVDDILRPLHDQFEPAARAKGLRLSARPCRLRVRSDPALLARLLRNLVSNAIRYTRQGRIVLGCRRHGPSLRIAVWDTGIGIPQAAQEDIFREFFQVDNPERDRTKGVGLGLAIVDRAARLLGHTVVVRSIPGRGSMFAIEVPWDRAMAKATAPTPASARPAGSGMRWPANGPMVLIIEDDRDVAESLAQFLDQQGCMTVTAESGQAAISELDGIGRTPDVIVADYRLGPETGVDAVQAVRAWSGTRVPALLVTGETDPEHLAHARRSGLDIHHKPVSPDVLLASIADRIASPTAAEPDDAEPIDAARIA